MNTYFIRVSKNDYETMVALGEKLGAITVNKDEQDRVYISATEGGAWDYIGYIPDADGNPIKDANGVEYIHVNLVTPLSLFERAKALSGDEDVAAALANLDKFFLLDAKGDACPPSNPYRVFL